MNEDIATVAKGGALAEKRASKAAANIHVLNAAEQIAERVKDPAALEQAIHDKFDSQAEFAVEYRAIFPHRGVMPINARTGVNSSPADWCLGYGFALRTVQRWLDLLDPVKRAEKKAAVSKRCLELVQLWQAANYSSESNEWYTPSKYIAAVREVLGDIDLDPASSAQANSTVRAKEIFTQEDDGLARDWFGRVFVNPPYGKTPEHRSLAAAFCNKAIDEFECENIEACIILVNSLHSQTWQAPLYDHAICFVDHRIHFVSADGEENENPTFQNIFVYLGRDTAKFADVFSSVGYVMKKV